MPLSIRLAEMSDHERLERMVIECFEPITWQKTLDETIEPLNGCDWRKRWRSRLQIIFATQVVLIGEADGQVAAMASATLDREAALGFIDVLAVAREFQGRGLGRDMLRGMIEHLRVAGMRYVHLDCLTNNQAGNALYESEGFMEAARQIRWFRRI
jgi:ribosomal protein S18 acetylase RimI-like enzyme